MTAIVIALALGGLAGGAISAALARDAYEARMPPTLTIDEWQQINAEKAAASMAAVALAAADAAARLSELARRAAIMADPRTYLS